MKKILSFIFMFFVTLSLSACNKGVEVTLDLSFGERTGTYYGDLVDGVPHGEGKFVTENSKGEGWTYEGDFVYGHFEGEGTTTWDDGQKEIGTYKNDVIVPMNGSEIADFYVSNEKYKYHVVEFVGQLFTAPEKYDGGVCFQMFTDIENNNNNTIVYVNDSRFTVYDGEYVKVVGVVGDVFEGTNAFGGIVTAPTITAYECEVISYIDAVSPTLKSVYVGSSISKYGYEVMVEKIEFAKNETRVYVKVTNNGGANFTMYSFNAKISQNGKQYSEQDNWDADYEWVEDDLMPGNYSEGIIAFPVLNQSNFTIYFDAHSDDWDEEFDNTFVFDVRVN